MNAIDTIGQIGSKSDHAAARLRDLLKLAYSQLDEERTLFAMHVVQAFGKCGYKAQGMIGDLANITSIDPALVPAVENAEYQILNSKAPTPTPAPVQNQQQQQPQQPDPKVVAVQTQLAAVQTAVKALSDALTKLSDAVGQLPGAQKPANPPPAAVQ